MGCIIFVAWDIFCVEFIRLEKGVQTLDITWILVENFWMNLEPN